jgi:protein-disulfide isomerase
MEAMFMTQPETLTKRDDDHPHDKPVKNPQKISGWLLPVLFLASIAVIGFLDIQNLPEKEPEGMITTDLRAIGPETAPVTIVEYADFACITCKAWHQFGIREQVLKEYGDQVRFVWHDFPVTSPASPKAAEAGYCAHDQDQFWAYHDILFANAPALAVDHLKAYADEIGLDMQQFNNCLDSGEHQQSVESALNAAMDLGLRSVPSFMVNQRRLIGPPSFEQLSNAIDELLLTQD